MQKHFCFATILFAISFSGGGDADREQQTKEPPAAAAVDDLSGFYTCKGEADGRNYSGMCRITRRGDVYLVSWMVGSGQAFMGIGLRVGNQFSVGWALPNPEGQLVRGVNTYRVSAGGKVLDGRWATLPGKTSAGVEKLERLADDLED